MPLPRKPARYCPYCATRLVQADDHGVMRPTCPACGFIAYRNPAPAVGVILERDEHIVLVRRRFEPMAGLWSLPAGFMEYGESPEATAVRETLEETGLEIELTGLQNAYRAGADTGVPVLLLVYRARLVGGTLVAGDDADEAGWFAAHARPEMAFRSHRRALREFDAALRRERRTRG
jgi:ADP-ribose pyrophosphatase YjhB (NUDIX family)